MGGKKGRTNPVKQGDFAYAPVEAAADEAHDVGEEAL